MALNNLQGKAAIITGAGAGINLCFAKLLLSKGCNVVFADLQLRPESKEVIDAHQSGSPKAVFQETNVTDWMQLERMFKVCEDRFGSADIVCPGAGVFEPVSRLPWSLRVIMSANMYSHFRISGFPQASDHRRIHPMATATSVSISTLLIQYVRLNLRSPTSSRMTSPVAWCTSQVLQLRVQASWFHCTTHQKQPSVLS